jgi:hypothetical protein
VPHGRDTTQNRDLRRIRLLAVLLAVLVSAVAVSAEIVETAYAHAAATAELPAAASAEAADGEEHPQPDVGANESTTRRATYPMLVAEPRPLIIDGRPFRPPLQYRLQA